jgi:hypothetical protein
MREGVCVCVQGHETTHSSVSRSSSGSVDGAVGELVGVAVGEMVGASVGDAVGDRVGDVVGDRVGDSVGERVTGCCSIGEKLVSRVDPGAPHGQTDILPLDN